MTVDQLVAGMVAVGNEKAYALGQLSGYARCRADVLSHLRLFDEASGKRVALLTEDELLKLIEEAK